MLRCRASSSTVVTADCTATLLSAFALVLSAFSLRGELQDGGPRDLHSAGHSIRPRRGRRHGSVRGSDHRHQLGRTHGHCVVDGTDRRRSEDEAGEALLQRLPRRASDRPGRAQPLVRAAVDCRARHVQRHGALLPGRQSAAEAGGGSGRLPLLAAASSPRRRPDPTSSTACSARSRHRSCFERTLPWVSEQQLGSRRITISMPEKGWSAAPAAETAPPAQPRGRVSRSEHGLRLMLRGRCSAKHEQSLTSRFSGRSTDHA